MSLKKNSRNIAGLHAFLSPSSYHWLDYDEDKLRRVFFQKQQTALGDRLHVFAQQAIELKIKLPDNGTTLSRYINDAIGFRMEPEFPLYYSQDCFGTADTLGVRDNVLRIHDLKTGLTPADMKQLLIYAGIFFFDFKELYTPKDLRTVLRIYQNDTVTEFEPELPDLYMVMDRIKTMAALVAYMREEEL